MFVCLFFILLSWGRWGDFRRFICSCNWSYVLFNLDEWIWSIIVCLEEIFLFKIDFVRIYFFIFLVVLFVVVFLILFLLFIFDIIIVFLLSMLVFIYMWVISINEWDELKLFLMMLLLIGIFCVLINVLTTWVILIDGNVGYVIEEFG